MTPNGAKRDRSSAANRGDREALLAAFREGEARPPVSPKMLAAIRQICTDARDREEGPERALVEFKLALADAANAAEMPLGPERSKLLAGLVSTFISELYDSAGKSTGKSRSFDCGDTPSASR